MADNSQNAKRLAKNTVLLYVRMFISMIISLYTSRVILATLGVEDYGIYNVVGGLVGMLGIITSTFNMAVSRFLTFELGKEDIYRLKRVFYTSLTIQVILSIIIVILAEAVGIWYINNVMVLPANRLVAAHWCYQFSIITCVLGLIIVPYNSVIIAHEHMSIYAYMGIFSSLFALGIAILIDYSPIDKLVFYGLLLMTSTVITCLVYIYYCKKHFEEARFKISIDREMFRSMFGFAGWNFVGAGTSILRDHSGNLLINFFFGPAINAARGISNAVGHAIVQFSSNFTIALKPQITKSYASGDFNYMFRLIYQGTKLSVYLMLFVSAPVLLNTSFILGVWLKEVPDHAVLFTQLTLVNTIVELISGPITTTIFATGKIRKYEILSGGFHILNILLVWLLFRFGFFPEIVILASTFIAHCNLAVRLYVLKGLVNISIGSFLRKVYLNLVVVAAIGFFIPFLSHLFLPEGLVNFLITSIICVISMGLTMLYIGCDSSERTFIFTSVTKFINKFIKRKHE